jgi:hypothetical protein
MYCSAKSEGLQCKVTLYKLAQAAQQGPRLTNGPDLLIVEERYAVEGVGRWRRAGCWRPLAFEAAQDGAATADGPAFAATIEGNGAQGGSIQFWAVYPG